MGKRFGCLLVAGWFMGWASYAAAQVRITEYMYDGTDGEFVELTNLGGAMVDMTGWTLDDDGGTAGSIDLSPFSSVAAGESVVIAQSADAATFRTAWGLPITVQVIAYTGGQYQRNDTITVRDGAAVLVTELAYGDQDFPGTIRTTTRSGWPCAEVLGQSPISNSWYLSFVSDPQGSFTSVGADVGSPGSFVQFFCAAAPTGACCALGNCMDPVTQLDCQAAGSVYAGDGTACQPVNPCPAPASGAMRITEYMYTGSGDEFIEFTNLDNHPIDMTGWSYDDDSAVPGTVDLSAFGVVVPGQSVILCEAPAADFITDWGLVGVTVIGDLTANLGRNDEINLFDNTSALVDRLTYGDQTFPGTIRAQEISGWPCEDGIGANDIFKWYFSEVPDVQNSYVSNNGDTGNPGTFVSVSCEFCGNDVLDPGEECDGGDCCTPLTCTLVMAGTECRPAADICDSAESCDGISGDCPADLFADSNTSCRSSAGSCDVEEFCTGTGPDCPADGVAGAGTVCNPSAGVCDVEETCDGVGTDCPIDGFESSSVVCRAAAGVCDIDETCTGSGPDCPADALASGTVCRPAVGACDLDESCDGAAVDCPADEVITACANGDGCCAPGCNANEDDDCASVCGNGIVEPGEHCDDGNNIEADFCPADCFFEEGAPIPTVSTWGLVVLSILLLIGAKLQFGRRSVTAG